jgi:hypothetical protein
MRKNVRAPFALRDAQKLTPRRTCQSHGLGQHRCELEQNHLYVVEARNGRAAAQGLPSGRLASVWLYPNAQIRDPCVGSMCARPQETGPGILEGRQCRHNATAYPRRYRRGSGW